MEFTIMLSRKNITSTKGTTKGQTQKPVLVKANGKAQISTSTSTERDIMAIVSEIAVAQSTIAQGIATLIDYAKAQAKTQVVMQNDIAAFGLLLTSKGTQAKDTETQTKPKAKASTKTNTEPFETVLDALVDCAITNYNDGFVNEKIKEVSERPNSVTAGTKRMYLHTNENKLFKNARTHHNITLADAEVMFSAMFK
jgi:hypothetical protein